MKRKALLAITDCTAKAFETYSSRGFLPFVIEDSRWSDYTLDQAFMLRLLKIAAEGTDLDSAALMARNSLYQLKPMDPFAWTGGAELWVGLVRYDWPDAPEGWDCRKVVAGRWEDLPHKAAEFCQTLAPGVKVISIYALSAFKIAHEVLREAREFGLPEGEIRQVPTDLTGYPEWFKVAEAERQAFLADWRKGIEETEEVSE